VGIGPALGQAQTAAYPFANCFDQDGQKLIYLLIVREEVERSIQRFVAQGGGMVSQPAL
jgi:hypothetical protein